MKWWSMAQNARPFEKLLPKSSMEIFCAEREYLFMGIRSLLLYRLLLKNANVCRCSKFVSICASNDDNVHAM